MKRSNILSRSGRFAGRPSSELSQFTESVSFDWRLWREDIEGSIAHARALFKGALISRQELKEIVSGLEAIGREIAAGQFRWQPELEDVHMNIEAALTARAPAGSKLHTARSRNDQVALDMRLWLRKEVRAFQEELRGLQRSLLELATQNETVLIPGYTHLQRAQLVSVPHYLLAYMEMFDRDHQRLEDAWQRINVCPLGSGALAGSTLPVDREAVAVSLGFVDARGRPRLTQNSMDAVSDRDFAVEYCAAAALCAVHLSRLAEDLVLWSTEEFKFVEISDAYATGSSLMPQKKNPDAAELARGKSGRVVGNLTALLVVLKGLPMTYDRDLQEDKERLFDTSDTVRATTRVMTGMLDKVTFRQPACRAAAADPALLATDLVDYLVRKRVPFRQAHHLVGRLVGIALESGRTLSQLSLGEYQSVSPEFSREVLKLFDGEGSLERKQAVGSPGRRAVRSQLSRWRRLLR